MSSVLGHVSIEYVEGEADSYSAVRAEKGKEKRLFNTGNFPLDWYEALVWLYTQIPPVYAVTHMSSVDHFIMDTDGYTSVYLQVSETQDPILLNAEDFKADWENLFKPHYEFFCGAGETFASWEEFKGSMRKQRETVLAL